jgi:hypothetical protein
MEPIDDILIPPTPAKPEARRLRARHVLRVLAFIIVVAALLYAGKLLKFNADDTATQRWAAVTGVAPLFFFGLVLWWYAGRKVEELDRPLFRRPAENDTDARFGSSNQFLAGASVVATFTGLCSVIFGGILAWRPGALAPVSPGLAEIPLQPRPFLLLGAMLIVLGAVALGLARNGFWVVVSLLSGFFGIVAVAFGSAVAWHREVLLRAFPFLQHAQLSPRPILGMGALLVVLAVVALGLALRRKTPQA